MFKIFFPFSQQKQRLSSVKFFLSASLVKKSALGQQENSHQRQKGEKQRTLEPEESSEEEMMEECSLELIDRLGIVV